MFLFGLFISIILIFGGFIVAEILFYNINQRFFWRAFIPSYIRFTLLPNDTVELDCYDVLLEYFSLMIYCSALVLPFFALNFMGLVKLF